MNLSNWQEKPEILADFNIGGKRVSEAILNFENVSEEQIILAGIGKILIDLQNQAKNECSADLPTDRSKWSDTEKARYADRLVKLAASFSKSQIDMAEYCPERNWNFRKGESAAPLARAKKNSEKLTEAERKELIDFLSQK